MDDWPEVAAYEGASPQHPKTRVVRKRKPPTQLIISPESRAALDARLKSPEGKQCLDRFAELIIDWAIAQMHMDLLEALVREKDHVTLKEIWPEIVNAYFKALSNPGPQRSSNP